MTESELTLDRAIAAVEAQTKGVPAIDRLGAAAALAGELRDVSDQLLDRYVQAARAAGCSWTDVGTVLGVSKQAVQQRFVAEPGEPPAWPEHFMENTRRLIALAESEARGFSHQWLGTEHFLLALTTDDGLTGTALQRLGVTEQLVREGILDIVGPGHSSGRVTLGVAPRAKRALEAARKEANALGQRCVNPEHLLLALGAQKQSVAARILADLNATDARLRETLADLLAGEAPEMAAKLRRVPRRRGLRSA